MATKHLRIDGASLARAANDWSTRVVLGSAAFVAVFDFFGELFTCLFSPLGTPLGARMREGVSDEVLGEQVRRAVWLKDAGYALELSRMTRIELSGLKNAKTLLDKAAAAGHTTEYFPVIAKMI